MMKYQTGSAVWADETKQAVTVMTDGTSLGVDWMPFTATSYDPEERGRVAFKELTEDLAAGPIGDYVAWAPNPRPQPTAAELMAQMEAIQKQLVTLMGQPEGGPK